MDNSNMTKRRDAVLNHLRAKTRWMQGCFGSYAGSHPEPERDRTEAAPLPPYVMSGAALTASDSDGNHEVIYYDLQGNRIEHPLAGRIYIRVSGSDASKVKL